MAFVTSTLGESSLANLFIDQSRFANHVSLLATQLALFNQNS